MDWVDIVVLVVLVLAALHGLRVGAVIQVLSLGGFVLGVTVGALLADVVAPSVHTAAAKTAVALALVVGLGAIFGILGRMVGAWANVAARRFRLGPLDSAAGVGVALVAALFGVWLVANELVQAPYGWLSSAIERSALVRAVDGVMPPLPDVFSKVQGFLGDSGFPSVFSELEPTPLHVSLPSAASAQRIAASAVASTVKVLGQACGYEQEGSAFVVGPGAVVTNAHVVAGERATTVVVQGEEYPATVVYFDPTYDLAVLRTGAPLGPALTIDASTVPAGTDAAVIGYPEDGPLTVVPAAVADQLTATGRNIYDEGTVARQVYQIDADVEPGNSGGPLVDSSGQVVGVVFSRSTAYADVGYALTSPGVRARVLGAEGRTSAAATGGCTTG
ncbi:MAG TPA: MarP family serine protease [Acidimicrobiales bacterium]|nr:MarP family serine protease [Acidimicrobiales bacterium]